MATMATEDHIDAHIIIDGAEATEYPAEPQKDEATGQEVTTTYVEVVSGAQFSFQGTISPQYRYGREDSLVMRVYIDGIYSGGSVWDKCRHNHLTGSKIKVEYIWEETGTSARKLMYHFADLETRDTTAADELKGMTSQFDKLGTLQVTISREMRDGRGGPEHNAVENTGVVPEKALKGRCLNVAAQFKPGGYGVAPLSACVVPIDPHPFFVKNFLYRTRKALQSEMIIPRSPSPQPLEERAEEDLTPEEMRELIRRQKEKLATKQEVKPTKLKRERSSSPSLPTRPLKSSRDRDGKRIYHLESDDDEPQPKSMPEQPDESIETIDLS